MTHLNLWKLKLSAFAAAPIYSKKSLSVGGLPFQFPARTVERMALRTPTNSSPENWQVYRKWMKKPGVVAACYASDGAKTRSTGAKRQTLPWKRTKPETKPQS